MGHKEKLAVCSCKESPKPSSIKTALPDKLYLQTYTLQNQKSTRTTGPKDRSSPLWQGQPLQILLWTLLSQSLKREHSWIWTHRGKFWMILHPPTRDKLLAALKCCCEVSRALGPAQHCSILTVLSRQSHWSSGIQTILPGKLTVSPPDGRRDTVQVLHIKSREWKKKQIPSSLQYDTPKPRASTSCPRTMFFSLVFLLLLPIANPKVNSCWEAFLSISHSILKLPEYGGVWPAPHPLRTDDTFWTEF